MADGLRGECLVRPQSICRKSRCCFARLPTRESAEFTTHKNLSLLEFSRNPHSINGWYGWFIRHGWFPQIFPMNNSISLGDFPAPLDYTRGNHHWSPIIIVNHVSPLIIIYYIYNDHYCRYQRTSSRGHRAWLDSFAASSGPWSRGSEPAKWWSKMEISTGFTSKNGHSTCFN